MLGLTPVAGSRCSVTIAGRRGRSWRWRDGTSTTVATSSPSSPVPPSSRLTWGWLQPRHPTLSRSTQSETVSSACPATIAPTPMDTMTARTAKYACHSGRVTAETAGLRDCGIPVTADIVTTDTWEHCGLCCRGTANTVDPTSAVWGHKDCMIAFTSGVARTAGMRVTANLRVSVAAEHVSPLAARYCCHLEESVQPRVAEKVCACR